MVGMAIAHDLYRTMRNVDLSTDSEFLEVKEPIIFLGRVGFLRAREGRCTF